MTTTTAAAAAGKTAYKALPLPPTKYQSAGVRHFLVLDA
jgi:hypothetical protein